MIIFPLDSICPLSFFTVKYKNGKSILWTGMAIMEASVSSERSNCPIGLKICKEYRFLSVLFRKEKSICPSARTGFGKALINDSESSLPPRRISSLHFHLNTSLFAVSIAKAVAWIARPKEERKTFSMADVKTIMHNQLLLEKFFPTFEIDPKSHKNNPKLMELYTLGIIAV